MNTFGETIKDWRLARGMTQSDLAKLAGVSRHTVISIENGFDNPGIETVSKILRCFGKQLTIIPVRQKPLNKSARDANASVEAPALREMFEREASRYGAL